jgi:hypothetical protein
MLVAACLRYLAGRQWGLRRYLNMALLRAEEPAVKAAEAC